MKKIPIPKSPWSEKEVSIDGVNLIFEFSYNQRNEGWHINIKDIVGRSLVNGIKLSENWGVGLRYSARVKEAIGLEGDFLFLRTRRSLKPTRDNIFTDFMLVYATDEDSDFPLISPPVDIKLATPEEQPDYSLSDDDDGLTLSANIATLTLTPI